MGYREEFFRAAFELAEKGRGKSGINPFVGAILVKDDQIIGRGYTQACGGNHAEIEAILNATESTDGAELYVTLEPCCHFGRTPPCTGALIKAGIKRVYAGITDPNPLVNGKGFQALQDAGIEVQAGFMKEEIEQQLEYYLTNRAKHRPFIMMKNAVSLDGKIATAEGDSRWITTADSREYTHRLRREAGAVVTGIDTVLSDDPLLNVRLQGRSEPVLRIILDSRLRIPPDSQIVKTAVEIPTIIFKRDDYSEPEKEDLLKDHKIRILSLPAVNSVYLSLDALLEELYSMEIPLLLLEAGSRLSSSFLKAGLVDKIYYFIAPKLIGGHNTVLNDLGISKLQEAIDLRIERIERIDKDILLIGYPEYK